MTESKNEQYQKFKEAARKLETNDDEGAFDGILRKVAQNKQQKGDKERPQKGDRGT